MKLLVVEKESDSPHDQSMNEILSIYGYSPTVCNCGLDAIELFKEEMDFEAVFTNILLPVMNGVELAKELVKINSTIPIIAVSGASQDVLDKFEVTSDIFFYFIKKPYTAADFYLPLSKIKAFAVS